MENQIVWVDIPVIDLSRAIEFYSAILKGKVKKEEFEHFTVGILPHAQTNVSGCLVPSAPEQIFTSGPLIYFNVNGRLDDAIKQSEIHGGRLVEEKISIGGHGFRAIIHDSEGNRIALHSNTP
ncbi:VOC family protein [Colwellia sp. C1TZA3]|uniref:VOC family protein n=1 Tax=Colwellia sp. C1TZA3 TaxID=2508879 RepID=UPI0011B97C4A|nr:VOC family protein [Colwellia sp. C1TZA3]TWX73311.1 VOC family protein [Colwellia sp. C1TZA3]